jgi:hypothetical protein
MKRLLLIVLFAVGASLISMCEKKDIVFGLSGDPFEGIVQDSVTLAPIESVRVNPVDTAPEFVVIRTDPNGFFEFFEGSGSSELPFFFRKNGYVAKVCTLTAGQRDTINIGKQ